MSDICATLFQMPPRIPDINPIKNFFYLINKLNTDTLENNITKEKYKEFTDCVK